VRGFWRSSALAARIAGERSDLWIPGALASVAFLGWLPFVGAVVPLPNAADLAFFGADLYTSSRWPVNAVQLVAGTLLVLTAASLLVALGEAALLRRLARNRPVRSLGDDTARVWLVQLVAALPAIAAAAVLVFAVAAVAPGEYQSPDIGGSLEVRIARDIAPFVAVLLLAIVAGQVLGGTATQRAASPADVGIGDALSAAVGDIRRDARRLIGLAVVTLLAYAIALLLAFALLRVLWSPIELQLARGQLGGPQTLLLLVGFVAIWLCLLVGIGALHAWASAWWTLELERTALEQAEGTPSVEGIGQA
jgi:hypothetical protein